MRYSKIAALIVLFISCYSCTTYYPTLSYTEPHPSCNPQIFKGRDLFGLDAKYISSLNIGDPYYSVAIKKYTDSAATAVLKSQACAVNANLVSVVFEIKPGEIKPGFQPEKYYRCLADFYIFEENELNLKIIKAGKRKRIACENQNRLLVTDIDNELPESFPVPYDFFFTIELYAGKMSIWTGTFKDYHAQGLFYCDISRIKKSFSSIEAEKQLELLSSLTQLYAKRLEKDLNSRKPRISNREKIQTVVNNCLDDLEAETIKFNLETDFGADKNAVAKWESFIKSELAQFE